MGHENEENEENNPVVFLTDALVKSKAVDGEIPPTRLLHTFGQRKAFIVKSMDLHRHTIGGGRSGRRGRAECVAFLRYALEILEEQREEALEACAVDEETGIVIEGKLGEGDVLSDSEEESSEEEDEEVEEEEPEPVKSAPKKRGRPAKTSQAAVKKNVERAVIRNEKEFFEQHNDLCEVCHCPGELLCCATCNLVFHTKCTRPKLLKEPDDDWKCSYCIADGVSGGKKEGRERRKAAQVGTI